MHAVPVRRVHTGADDAQQDDQRHFAARKAARGQRLGARGLQQHFQQAQHAPRNQKERPVLRHQLKQRNFLPQVPRQKRDTDQDQNQRPGQRTPRPHATPPAVGPDRVARLTSVSKPITIRITGHVC